MRYAIRNIFRLRAKSLLSFLICFAVFFLVMFGFLIRTISEDARYRFYGPLDGSVHVTDDTLAPYLTYEAAATLAHDAKSILRLSAFKEYIGHFSDMTYVGYGTFRRARYAGEELTEDRKSNYIKGFAIRAVTSMEILEESYTGQIEMLEGTAITDADTRMRMKKIVISETLAAENGLSLGDTVTLSTPSIFQSEIETSRFHLAEGIYGWHNFDEVYEIGGIYRHYIDNAAAVSEPWRLNANIVYVPITSIVDIGQTEGIQFLFAVDGQYALTQNPVVIPDHLYFHLSDMSKADALEEAINEIGFTKAVKLTEYVSDTSSSPSARLSGILSAILAGIIVVGFAILLLTVVFHMKSRKRELAMLCALGKKRSMTAFAFFSEYALLMLLSLVLSATALCAVIPVLSISLMTYLYSAENAAQFVTENADLYLFGHLRDEKALQILQHPSYLIEAYMPANCLFIILTALLLMLLLLVVSYLFTARINPLYDVGGKES